MENEKLLDEKLSRRNLLINGGKVAAGAAILSVAGLKAAKTADAYEFASAYKYVKLDTKEVGQITYENYFNRWCTSSVVAGLVDSLKKKAGGAWKDFPIDAYRWGHGGLAGWGALCGTMPGAGVVIGLVTKDTDTAEAGTPVCHISVGKWMRAEGVAFLAKERAERCARLSADVAMEAARMLNAWSEGSYKPKHKPLYNVLANGITSQNNCRDCHGEYTPSPSKTYDTLNK